MGAALLMLLSSLMTVELRIVCGPKTKGNLEGVLIVLADGRFCSRYDGYAYPYHAVQHDQQFEQEQQPFKYQKNAKDQCEKLSSMVSKSGPTELMKI